MSRFLFCAILATAVFAIPFESSAKSHGHGYHHKKAHRLYLDRDCVGGHKCHPDWPDWGFLFGPYRVPYSYNTGLYNYPGHYNNHSFWERIQTQGNYPVQY
jgi:hypothetical protein